MTGETAGGREARDGEIGRGSTSTRRLEGGGGGGGGGEAAPGRVRRRGGGREGTRETRGAPEGTRPGRFLCLLRSRRRGVPIRRARRGRTSSPRSRRSARGSSASVNPRAPAPATMDRRGEGGTAIEHPKPSPREVRRRPRRRCLSSTWPLQTAAGEARGDGGRRGGGKKRRCRASCATSTMDVATEYSSAGGGTTWRPARTLAREAHARVDSSLARRRHGRRRRAVRLHGVPRRVFVFSGARSCRFGVPRRARRRVLAVATRPRRCRSPWSTGSAFTPRGRVARRAACALARAP